MPDRPHEMPAPQHRRLGVGKLHINVTDWGGEGRAIFFAHPTGFLGMVWKPLITRLRGLGVRSRIYTYDQRGHGLSSKPDNDYDWTRFVTDTEAVMDQLGIEDALGVGHSAGATTLAGVAADHPRRMRRLVMIDPVLFHPELARLVAEAGVNPMSARTRTRRTVWSSRQEMFQSFRRREPYDTWTEEALSVYVEEGTFDRPDGEIELLCPARVEGHIYGTASSFDGYGAIARVRIPILLLRGQHSTTLDEERARRVVEIAQDARLVTVPGTTHFLPMEKPDEIARAIAQEGAAGTSAERAPME